MRSECPTGKFCNFLAMDILIMKPTPERRRSSLFFQTRRGYSLLLHLPWGSLVPQSVLRWGQRHRCPAEQVPWHECWASFRTISRVLHRANVPACYLEICCLLLSFFLPLGRDARRPQLANQVGVRETLFRPPFLGPSPRRASSAVPREGCLVAQSAAKCC